MGVRGLITLRGQISIKRLSGRACISKATDLKVTLEDRTVTPTAAEQTIEHRDGFDGLGVVTVVGDSNFIAKNIKLGVTIWGVEGTGVAPPFSAKAAGGLAMVYKGTARSTGLSSSNLIFESSATGALANAEG